VGDIRRKKTYKNKAKMLAMARPAIAPPFVLPTTHADKLIVAKVRSVDSFAHGDALSVTRDASAGMFNAAAAAAARD
jgi:hypothetical protein